MAQGIHNDAGLDTSSLDKALERLNNILDKSEQINKSKIKLQTDDSPIKTLEESLKKVEKKINENKLKITPELVFNHPDIQKEIKETEKIIQDNISKIDAKRAKATKKLEKPTTGRANQYWKKNSDGFLEETQAFRDEEIRIDEDISQRFSNEIDTIYENTLKLISIYKKSGKEIKEAYKAWAQDFSPEIGEDMIRYYAEMDASDIIEATTDKIIKSYEQQGKLEKDTINKNISQIKEANQREIESLRESRNELVAELKNTFTQINNSVGDDQGLDIDLETWGKFQKQAYDLINTMSTMGVEVKDLEDLFEQLQNKIYIPQDQFNPLKGSFKESSKEAANEIDILNNEVARLQLLLSQSVDIKDFEELQEDLSNAYNHINRLNESLREYKDLAENRYTSDEFDDLAARTWEYSDALNQTKAKLDALQKEYDALKEAKKSTDSIGTTDKESDVFNESELSNYITLLNEIKEILNQISTALGKVDDNSGFSSLISSVDILLGKLDDVYSKIGTGVYNIQVNQGVDKTAQENIAATSDFVKSTRSRYANAYTKIADIAGGEEKLFAYINNAINFKGGIDELYKTFGSANVSQLTSAESQIYRMMDFFKVLRQAIDTGDFGLNLSGIRLPSGNDANFRKQLKEKSGLNKSDEEILNLDDDKVNLDGVIEKLEEIRDLLSDISKKDLLGDSLNKVSEKLDEIALKFENIISKVEVVNIDPIKTSDIETETAVGNVREEIKSATEAQKEYNETLKERQTISTNTSDVDSINKANEAIKEEGKSAETSAIQKEKFSEANNNIASASEKTTDSVNKTTEAIKEEGEEAKKELAILEDELAIKEDLNKQHHVLNTSHTTRTNPDGTTQDISRRYTYEDDMGRKVKRTESYDNNGNISVKTQQMTNYEDLVNRAAKAYVKLTKAQHDFDIENGKGTRANQNYLDTLNDRIRQSTNELREAARAAREFIIETEHFYNETGEGSKFTTQQFRNDFTNKAFDSLNKEEQRYSQILPKQFEKRLGQLNNNLIDLSFEKENGNHTDAFKKRLDDMITQINQLNSIDLDLITQDEINNAEQLLNDIKLIRKEGKLSANRQANENSVSKNLGKINKLLSENTRFSFRNTQVFTDLQTLQKEFQSFDTSRPQKELDELNTRLLKTMADFEGLSDSIKGKNIFQQIGEHVRSTVSQLAAQYLSFQDIVRYARTAATTLVDLDTQLVDLRKTTSMTSTELNQFYNSSSDIAKQLGVTTSEIISQAAAWSRLGYSTKEAATEMSKLSSQFASISPGMDTESSTDYLVSTMQAFGISVDEVQRKIMDNVNAIGNSMATSNSEIGEMLARSSAAMKAANNSLEETIALESAAVEVTRNAETTGTAFRTISMRIRGYDEETEELSEDLENISGDIANLTKIAGKGGITIFSDKDKSEYKSTYQILKEISEIWDQLTDKQQAQLLEKLGGKRGAQSIASILADFSSVTEAMQTMETAAGSSDREMEIITQSLEYKINALKQTWVGVLTEIADKGTIGGFLDILNSMSEGIGGLIEKIGLIPSGIGIFGTLFGAKNLGLASVQQGKMAFGKQGILGMLGDVEKKGNLDYLQQVHDAIIGMSDLQNPISDIGQTLDNIADGADDASGQIKTFVKQLEKSGTNGANALGQVNDQIQNVKQSSTALGLVFKNIGATLINMVASAAISAAISAIVVSIQKLSSSYDDLMKKVQGYTQEYKDSNQELSDYSKRIEELQNIMNSSSSTTQEVASATSELYDIQNNLISTYGGYANGIDLVNGKLETQLDILKNIDNQNLKSTINNIAGERSAKESAYNLFRNLTLFDVGDEGGVVLPQTVGGALGTGIIKGLHAVLDKDTTLEDVFFGNQGKTRLVDNIKDIRNEVEDYSKTISGIKFDDTTLNFIKGLETFDYDFKTGSVKIHGQVEDVKQDIGTLQDLLNEAGIDNKKLSDQLTEYSYDTTEIIEQNIEAYNDILRNALVNGGDYSLIQKGQQDKAREYYNDLTKIYEQYHEAVISGNDSLAKSYSTSYAETFDEIRNEIINNSGIDNAFVDYFKKLYPELQNVISGWDIKKDIDKELELEWDLSKYLKNTSLEDIKSDYFRVINNLDTVSEVEANRFEQLGKWAAAHDKDVVHLVEDYKRLDDQLSNTASSLDSLSVVAPSFEAITTALSEQGSQGFLSKETMESLNTMYGDFFQKFGDEANRTEEYISSINKELERMQKGGNVNLTLRPEIDTSELEKAGWGTDKNGNAINLGDYATVYTSTFSDDYGTRYINFTPIVVDPETGEYKETLSPEGLEQYARDVINGTRTDDLNLQIGSSFATPDDAEKAAEKIHNLHSELHNANENIFLELKSSLYEFTENGVNVSRDALNKYNEILSEVALTSARLKEADAVQKYQKEAKYLEELVGEHDALKNAYDKGADALKQYVNSDNNLNEALVEDINNSMERLSVLSEEINKYDMLEAQIRATTSTLNEYNQATQTANEKDNFDTAHSMVASLKDAMEKGWTGTDEFKKGMEYIGGYNFDPNIMEYGDNYDSSWVQQFKERIAQAERYFTEDISGIYNFLDDAVEKTEHTMVDFVDDAYVINIDNVDEFAKKMDMSVSEAMDLLLATDEAWDFNLDISSIEDGLIDGLHAIDEESVNARTDLDKYRESINKLAHEGYDVSELEAAFSDVAKTIAPDFAIDEDISNYNSESIRRWADSIVKEAENDISGVKVDFNADVEGLSGTIDKLKEIKANAKIKGEFDETEYRHVSVVLQALLDQKHELESQSIMNVDTSTMSEGADGVLSVVQSYVKAYQELENVQTLGIDDTQLQVAEQRVENIKTQLNNIDVSKLAELGIDTAEISVDADPTQLYETVTNIDVNKNTGKKEVKIGADDSQAKTTLNNFVNTVNDSYGEVEIGAKLGDNFIDNTQSLLDGHTYTIKIKTQTPNVTGILNGDAGAEGGKITHASANNLVGELGQELLVRDGRYYTIGDNGAEMVPLRQGDIIFNAKQTAELLKNGQIKSRGKLIGNSFAQGNAYDNNTTTHGGGPDNKAGTKTWKETASDIEKAAESAEKAAEKTEKTTKKLKEVTKDTAETFDWIEVRLQRLSEAVQSLDKTVTNTYEKWDTRNVYLDKEIAKVTEELNAQIKAQERYQKVWAKGEKEYSKGKGKKGVKISNKPKKKDYKTGEDSNGKAEYNTAQYNYDLEQYKKARKLWKSGEYQKKIEEGQIGDKDIEKIKNKYLVEAIKEYQELYNKGVQAEQAAEDNRIKLKELNKQKLDNIIEEWSELIDIVESAIDRLDKYVDTMESLGYFVNKGLYSKSIASLEQRQEMEAQDLEEARRKFNELVNNGTLVPGSSEYNKAKKELLDLEDAYNTTVANIKKKKKEAREEDWERFDYLQERLSDITKEAEYLQNLASSEKMMDDYGYANKRGYVNLAMIASKYNEATRSLEDYRTERENFEKDMDWNNRDDVKHWQDLTDKIRESGEAVSELGQETKSFYEELFNQHLAKLKEVMDEYKNTLSAAKDLYDFQKNIGNQTKNIENLRKQLTAYQGDDSEAARKRRQELTNQLNQAEQQLQETEWDRYINQTGEMLDNLYEDYEENLNSRLDNIQGLMSEMIRATNENATTVKAGLEELQKENGAQIDNFKPFLTQAEQDLVSGVNNGTLSDTATAISNIADAIEAKTKEMFDNEQSMRESLDGMKELLFNEFGEAISKSSNGVDSVYTMTFNDYLQNGRPNTSAPVAIDLGDNATIQDITTTLNSKLEDTPKKQHFKAQNLEKEVGKVFADETLFVKGSKKKSEYGDLNEYLYEKNNGYVLTKEGLSILRKLLDVKDNDALFKALKKLNNVPNVKGFATGSKHILSDQLAWTQERGSELIFRRSDGAMLTPLGSGDMVFTNSMSRKLWELAKELDSAKFSLLSASAQLPDINSNLNTTINQNNQIEITLPNVNDYASFKYELQNDIKFEKFIQEITLGQAMGNNTLNKRKY